ncbi:Gfo/Idh/MocA family oxidoreductase [Botrimarina sp.]|uniref:Gfo/Idh/MocA family protein n=1 Tax=Botrimarina sp. TaxID=2795802 RepID=UPI0032EC569C
MRVGIIGAGAIGEKHAAACQAVGVEVGWVIDRDEARAAKLADAHHATAKADPEHLWEDGSVGAVVVGVPNCFHKPLAIEAMQAGKDVLLEKPMAFTAQECDEILSVAESTGRLLQIGYAHRFTAVGAGAKQVIDTGALGEIYHAKAHLHLRRGVPGLGGWFTNKQMAGGGALIDLGVHLIDLALYLAGEPKPVAVSGKAYNKFGGRMKDYVYESMWAGPPNYNGVFDVDDHATAMIMLEGGATIDLQVAWACNLPSPSAPDSVVALLGDKGGVSFELFGDHLLMRSETARLNSETRLALPAADPMASQMKDFVKAVESREHGVGASPVEGRRVQAIVDAIYKSSETNRPVEF